MTEQEAKRAPTPEEIQELYDELGRPPAQKFAKELRSTFGMKISAADVQKNIVGLYSERHVVAKLPKYEGKIFSLGLDEKWFADVMVLPTESSVRHVLVVQGVFSRFLWATPMTGQAAVIEPMRDIMRVRKPTALSTDADAAFTSRAFRAAMEELGVEARLKAGRNDIATVGRAIGILEETIQRFRSSSGEADWGSSCRSPLGLSTVVSTTGWISAPKKCPGRLGP